MIQLFPDWAFWSFAVIGYFFFSWMLGNIIVRMSLPLWKEAKQKEKRIELVASIAGVLAFLISAAGLFYTVRQVDAVTDRISALEKAVEAMKVKPEAPKS